LGLVEALNGEGALVFVVRVAAFEAGPDVVLSDHGVRARATGDSVACAIRFARARVSDLGSDDPMVVLTGLSMGGGIAAHVALFGETLEARWDEFAAAGGPPREVDCEVSGGSTHVDAVIGMAGTYDAYVPIYDGKWGRAYQQEIDPELQRFLSSSIGANPDLKVRMIHGTSDFVPVDEAAEFAELLTDAGYDVQLATFEGGHGEPPTDLYSSTIKEVLDDQ
jgi:acetyl esterase/lipase